MLNWKIFQILELLCMTVSKTYLLSHKISRKFALVPVHKNYTYWKMAQEVKVFPFLTDTWFEGKNNFLLRNPPPSKYIHKTNKYNQMMKIIFTEILPSSVYFSGSKVKQRQVDCTCLSLGII